MLQNYYTKFLTATSFSWYHLLKDDSHKHIIPDSFDWLVKEKKYVINAFVIISNQHHLIWKISDDFERQNVQGAFFSFTAHQFKKELKKNNQALLEDHFVNKIDREYQFWQRESMVKECRTKKFFQQKFNYTHFNLPASLESGREA